MSLHLRDILVVEDNVNDVELMLLSLGELKLANDIVIVRDGVEGLDYLYKRGRFAAREGGQPLFMMLDLNMPRMGGIDMLVEMRRDDSLRTLPVVIMTSSREDPDLRRCYDLGINAYVVKPVDFDQFSRTVTNLGVFWALINEPPPRI
ncbi:response regulator [Methyloversatilis sp. XJ19-49]|jgi:two-component system response regulator|uniref:response regulator n=1 Tax=Methyloversatilis sp. XJ19-49 TaxID=2963429 RepID=UPI00211CBCF5|nr:response regulator [Methyloversatilis sp. XJ19-49]MCQ9378656.1 response regulator [Methyloversatilis sp. XJ19-49]